VVTVLAVFLTLGGKAMAKDLVLRSATYHPVQHYLTDDAYKAYGAEIEKRTSGKVKFTWFFGGTMLKTPQTVKGVKQGLADFSVAALYYEPQMFPITSILDLPFMLENALHGSLAAWKMYQEIPEMRAEFEKAGLKPVAFFPTASMELGLINESITKLEQLKGKRIITPAPISLEIFKALGAAPQFICNMDIYMALHRKMAEGTTFPVAPMRSFKLTDMLSKFTVAGFNNNMHAYLMSTRTWNKLPKDVQAVFLEMGESAGALAGTTLVNEGNWVKEEMVKRGDTFYELPKEEKTRWVDACKPIHEAYIAKLGKLGYDGPAIYQKVLAIVEETRNQAYGPDSWWGNAGKKRDK
jgi:TRAP-type C4-dicarboxylate transport system substrate-binding protein